MIELFCAFSQEPRLRRGKVANARNLRSNAYNAVRRYGAFCTAFFLCPRFGITPLWRVCTAFFSMPSVRQSAVMARFAAKPRTGCVARYRYPESHSARRARVCAGKRSAKPRRVGEHRRFVRRIRRLSTRSRRRCEDCPRSCSRLRGGRVRSFWRWGRVCIRRKLSRCPQARG